MSGNRRPHPSPDITCHNHYKLFHTDANDLRCLRALKLIHTNQPPSWRTTPEAVHDCLFNIVPSISGGRLPYPQPEHTTPHAVVTGTYRLRVVENKVFRKVFGAKRETKLQESGESYIMLSYMHCILHLT